MKLYVVTEEPVEQIAAEPETLEQLISSMRHVPAEELATRQSGTWLDTGRLGSLTDLPLVPDDTLPRGFLYLRPHRRLADPIPEPEEATEATERRVIDCDALMRQMRRSPRLFRAVHRWLRLHGIDPRDVPVPSEMVIEDSAYGLVIRYEAYLTIDGHKYLDPDNLDRVATKHRTSLLHIAPPTWWISTEDSEL